MRSLAHRAALRRYQNDGFAVIEACFPAAAIDRMRAESARLWAEVDLSAARDDVHWRDHVEHGRIADRLDPVHTRSEFFAEVGRDRALLDFTEHIVGDRAFVLKDKLIMKRSGTAGYSVHQDLPYWQGLGLGANDFVTAMIALDDTTRDHGPVELYPGQHHQRLPADSDDPLDVDPSALAGVPPFAAELRSGDVLFFHPLAPHRSAGNRARGPRRVFMITYARACGPVEAIRARYQEVTRLVHKVHRGGVLHAPC